MSRFKHAQIFTIIKGAIKLGHFLMPTFKILNRKTIFISLCKRAY